MAVVTRKYTPVGVNDDELKQFVSPTATIAATVSTCVEASVDDAVAGTVEMLDAYMLRKGLVHDPSAGKETQVTLFSPDGSKWAIQVSNAGTISATNIP